MENNLTTYEYDPYDRQYKVRYPVPTAGAAASSTTDYEQLTYDPNSNITQRRLRDGGTITFSYDNLNRLTTLTPAGENAVNYTYNLAGQVTQTSRPGDGATLTQSYDALGRMLSESQPFGSASYQYDSAGRLTRITWSDAFYVTYDYDTAGNVTAIRENGAASGVGVLATYNYDNLGRRIGITRGNGTSSSYSFDPVSRLTSLSQDLSGTASDQTIGSMVYNPAGQITSQTKSNDAYAWSGHYNVARNYTVNGLNQQTLAGAVTLGYDGRGNLTTSGTSTYGYNKLNQLTSGPGTMLSYDPAGRLTQIVGGSGTTRFAYAGGQMIGEYDTSGTLLQRYVPGPGLNEPVVWYVGPGATARRWLHADERGSVIAVSEGSGAMLAINRYDEYGIPQSGNLGRFQYTGQAWVSELGLYDYKARMYSPTLGRFMQTDPIGYGDGLNWYNYVGSDPVNRVDPWGLDCDEPSPDNPCVTFVVTAHKKNTSIVYVWSYDYRFEEIHVGGASSPQSWPKDSVDWDKLGQCLKDSTLNHYGLGAATAVSGALSVPIPKAIVPPYRVIGAETTNLLSVVGHFVEINVPRMLNSTNLFRVAGRANPLLTGALLVVDVGMISYDTYQCYNNDGK